MISRTFSADELDLLRRCFNAGQPEPDMLAHPKFTFDRATLDAAQGCLVRARPGVEVIFSREAWDCLGACCAVGADRLRDLPGVNYDTVVRMVE
jgi:hypothetical protein